LQEQFILTAANHAAIVIARQELVGQAAEARVLREADAMKDTLLSLVSHELRTPLAAIKANASGLIGEHSYLSTAEKIEAIEAIDREVDRLALFVGNMLDLSRIEGGMWRPVRDWTDVDELVGAVVGQLPGAAAGRIAVHIDKEMPLIQIDDAQMAIVIRNLLDNALKYSAPDTQIDVSLGVLQDEDVGRCVLISVRDKGPTFSEAEAEHLFERFYRGARNPDGIPGTGLGLALCRAIVEAHGGTVGAVNVGSPEPDGVSFNIMLPFLDD
jgi:two-component system sensor histidine kinase KdpD